MSTFRTVVAALAAVAAMTACSQGGNIRSDITSETAGDVRSIDTVRGTVELPTSPLRIVTLEPVELDTAVALGVVPVGTAVLSEATGVPGYLGDEASDIELIGTVPAPRIESIAALRPDLILGTQTRHDDFYSQLTDIAPTVFLENHAAPWRDNVRFVARALGLEERAEDLLADYQDRCTEIKDKHNTVGLTAQLVRPRNGDLTLYGPSSFAGSTLECVGFTMPQRPEWATEISVDLSPELAAEANADLVVVTSSDPGGADAIPASIIANAATLSNPHAVDQAYWITGVGPKGGQAVLEDIDRILSQR